MLTIGATGSRGRLTSNTLKLHNTSCVASHGGDIGTMENLQDKQLLMILMQIWILTLYLSSDVFSPVSTADETPFTFTSSRVEAGYDINRANADKLLSDSFMSQTKQHYQPHIRPDCSGPFPNLVNKPRDSGFHQMRSLQKTGAMEEKTEYQRLFVPHRLTQAVSLNHVTVGPKRQTGFTEGAELQVQEKHNCMVKPHQTPSSVMKTDFQSQSFPQGAEVIPRLSSHSCRETGFTRGATALLACPSSLQPSHQTERRAPTKKTIGKKEPTGSLVNAPNNQAFPNAPFDRSHFTTHYESKFCHPADLENTKSGYRGIICTKMDNGYNHRDMDRYIFRG